MKMLVLRGYLEVYIHSEKYVNNNACTKGITSRVYIYIVKNMAMITIINDISKRKNVPICLEIR